LLRITPIVLPLIALGVSGLFSLVLAVQALWIRDARSVIGDSRAVQ
jgi:hypothetical protein